MTTTLSDFLRHGEREQCLRLIHEGGAGWDEFVRDKARHLSKTDPGLHGNLPAEVEEAIKARSAETTS
jgi:hypothetical protein